jgi:hypothetical protein
MSRDVLDSYCRHSDFCRIPTAYPQGQEGPVKIRVISGKSHNVESPVRPLGGCWYLHVIFEDEASVFQNLREHVSTYYILPVLTFPAIGWTAFIYGTFAATSRLLEPDCLQS